MDSFDLEPKTPEPVHDEKPLGMKWYKFLRYFGLIMGGIGNLSYGVLYLTGMVYLQEAQISPRQVYGYYGMGLQAADFIYGAMLIGMGVLAFIVRDKLAKFKSDTIRFLKILYVAGLIVPILYSAIASIITQTPLIDTEMIGSTIGSAAMIAVNISYFNHRAHLFVN